MPSPAPAPLAPPAVAELDLAAAALRQTGLGLPALYLFDGTVIFPPDGPLQAPR